MNKSTIGISSILLFAIVIAGSIILASNPSDHNDKRSIQEVGTETTTDQAISAYSNETNESAYEPTFLIENTDPVIKDLVTNYYDAILNANEEQYNQITVDDDGLEVDVILRKMEYIEGYNNQKIYVTQGVDNLGLVIYVVYDLKIHSIDTPAPSIDQLLIKNVEGEPKLYFNTLNEKEIKQLESIRSHEEVIALIENVDEDFVQAIKNDSHLNDFYLALSKKTENK